jgi:hypothetical protein
MKQHFARLLGCAMVIGLVALSGTPASAQAKTATQCRDEWRANKADNQAKGVTEKAYVAQCRAGGTAVETAPAAGPAPTAQSAQTKTATQCRDEWRANKADNQAKGVTEKAYVAQCRAGGTAAQTAPAPAPAPTAQPAPAAAPKTTAAPAPRPARTTAAATTGANQFANEAEAKSRCPSDTVVWVNEKSKIYHFSGHKDYGHTKVGAYMCEKDATAAGDRAAKDEKHP